MPGPPRRGFHQGVHEDDIVGGGEVESQAAGFEAYEEEVSFARLESVHLLHAFLGGCAPVEVAVADVPAVEVFADEGQMSHELAEDQRLVAVLEELRDDLSRRVRAWSLPAAIPKG